MYQTDWGILGLRLKYNKENNSQISLQLPISKINTSNQKINFGLTSDDEMDIIFGYYYEE